MGWVRGPGAAIDLDATPAEAAPDMDGRAIDVELSEAGSLPGPQQQVGRWRPGEVAMQGYFGVNEIEIGVDGGSRLELQDNDESFPVIGGGAQWKMAGDNIDLGFEGFLEISGSAGSGAFVAGGSGAALYVDFDLLMFNLYGGPFLSLPFGRAARAYAGAGPMLQWAFYDQDCEFDAGRGDGAGFGYGYYARTGFEFAVAPRMMVGGGVRWSETAADIDGGFGDLEMSGFQWTVTVTQGF